MPDDPTDCAVFVQAGIGPKGERGEELFSFTVVTANHLARLGLPRWGRGLFVVEYFSWSAVQRKRGLSTLLTRAAQMSTT